MVPLLYSLVFVTVGNRICWRCPWLVIEGDGGYEHLFISILGSRKVTLGNIRWNIYLWYDLADKTTTTTKKIGYYFGSSYEKKKNRWVLFITLLFLLTVAVPQISHLSVILVILSYHIIISHFSYISFFYFFLFIFQTPAIENNHIGRKR